MYSTGTQAVVQKKTLFTLLCIPNKCHHRTFPTLTHPSILGELCGKTRDPSCLLITIVRRCVLTTRPSRPSIHPPTLIHRPTHPPTRLLPLCTSITLARPPITPPSCLLTRREDQDINLDRNRTYTENTTEKKTNKTTVPGIDTYMPASTVELMPDSIALL